MDVIHHLCGDRTCTDPRHLVRVSPTVHVEIELEPAKSSGRFGEILEHPSLRGLRYMVITSASYGPDLGALIISECPSVPACWQGRHHRELRHGGLAHHRARHRTMRTYRQMARDLGVPMCGGGCGIASWVRDHDAGFVDPFNTVHFRERRFTRRGARNFLLLVARWERMNDPEMLNDLDLFDWEYQHRDAVRAQSLARQLGFRIPAHLFDYEREMCLLLARKRGVTLPPTIRAWATDR